MAAQSQGKYVHQFMSTIFIDTVVETQSHSINNCPLTACNISCE